MFACIEMNNKYMIQPTPIPIETCLWFDGSEKLNKDIKPNNDIKSEVVRDDNLFNRYWFNIPGEWLTSSNNEKIIGVRSVFLLKSKRALRFTICLRKYLKSDYKDAYTAVFKKVPDEDSMQYKVPSTSDLTKVLNKMTEDKKNISEITIPIASWMEEDSKLKKIYQDILTVCQPYIQKYNSKTDLPPTMPKFNVSKEDPADRDIQMDGYYVEGNRKHLTDEYPFFLRALEGSSECRSFNMVNDNNDFLQVFFSPRNLLKSDAYFVDIKFTTANNDFKDILNISDASKDSSTCNLASDLLKYSRCHVLKNVWDRSHCKIFSSLASQSDKNYLCHSDVHFNPIKYFIIKSTDTRFFIEFFAGRHPKIPIKLPRGESFFIEVQLEQNRKLLYV